MNRLRFWHFSAALGALWASACGSRSNLYGPADLGTGGDTGGTGGTGGSTTTSVTTTSATTTSTTITTTTTTSTTTTTTTLPPGPCTTLSYQQPFASLQGGSKEHQLFPAFAYASGDLQTVTIASGWQVAEGPMVPPIDLRHTSLAPWGMFPVAAGLGPSYLADLDGGGSFAIAQGTGDHFALLYAQPPAAGLRFSDGYKPVSGDIPATILADAQARTALFLSRTPEGHMYGAAFEQNGTAEVRVGAIQKEQVVSDFALGCTLGPALADAVPLGKSTAVAFTNGTTLGNKDGCAGAMPEALTHVQVARFDAGAIVSKVEMTTEMIADLRLAPRSDGAWIAWTRPGGNAAPSSIAVRRIDMSGIPTGDVITFPAPYNPGTLGLASFDDFLMVAWIEAVGPDGAEPHVQVIDPGGSLRGDILVLSGGVASGRLALLGSPSSHSAALAWTETVLGAGLGAQIRITRVDCLDP